MLKSLLLPMLFSIVWVSCGNLDSEVFSELTSENFEPTDENLLGQLSPAYSYLTSSGSHNNYWSCQAVSSDEMMLPQRGNEWFADDQWIRLQRHEQTPWESAIGSSWNTLYAGINNANQVIETILDHVEAGTLDQSTADLYIAETKVLRAYQYFWLLDLFGNVPIITSFSSIENNPATRDRAEVYAFVEKELSENLELLSKDNSSSTYGRFNYWAGKALQTRLYLNAIVYTGNPKWQETIDAANEIINSGLYALENNYFSNFDINNESSSENIFAIPYNANRNCCFEWAWMTLHNNSDQTFNLGAQPWNGYCVLEEFYNSYDDTDSRKGKWVTKKREEIFTLDLNILLMV